jgi:hypothetical protein
MAERNRQNLIQRLRNVILRQLIFNGILFLTLAASAEAKGQPTLTCLQASPIPLGTTFEIQATGLTSESHIYVWAFPTTDSVPFSNPYSSLSTAQADCNKKTCTWTYTNGGSPQLYSGSWTFYLAKVTTSGSGTVQSVTYLATTTIQIQ